ncbi:hypothetical protein BA059_16875 [Mycolicibacterium sp. (ex Dasyatis americana)]|nr:hypothetical protein BA059_16875 [Mycolicibacterium sp. (ex Dasyatis americana)]
MTTTTKLQDYLGRWLTNATPGTSDATDHLGRDVVSGDADFVGRDLTFDNPSAWVTATAYSEGDYVSLSGGEILQATEGGTSDAAEPTAPGVGNTVVDGTVTWLQVR